MPRPIHEFQKNAAECERMARATENEEDRALWRGLAEKWERMTPPDCFVDRLKFDCLEAEIATGQTVSNRQH